jgi:predicted regulator of Ras-like GTPase activity (Roadblock/LC7/MglB family)
MKQLIDELKAIPGVVGACVYSSREGLQETNLPGIFRADRLAAVGKQLTKLYTAGRMSFDDLTDVSLHYDESVVVARELQKNLLIFAICDPSFNHNLLSMSFNLLQEEFQNGQFGQAEVAEPLPSTSAPAVAASASQLDARQSDLLEQMKGKLGRVLGPMAGYIFAEVVEVWERQGASAERLDSLLELIDKEIADEDKSATYRRLIAPELQAFKEG